MKKDAPLMSEALMYAEFHRSSASKENIVRTMCGFFKSDELRAAKSLIYERFRSLDILENAADRRTTENRSDLMAMCCDLIDDLFKLEENNIQVVCAASNWKRLPRINPEEVTQISMADKLAQLESKFSFYDAALIDVKSMSSSMDVRIKNIEKGNTKKCPLIISNGRSDPTDINDTTAPQTVVKSDTYSDVVSRREHRTYRNQTDRSRMGSDFNKRTGNRGYPDM